MQPFSRRVKIWNWSLTSWKRALSYFKTDWELEDYPVALRQQEPKAAKGRFVEVKPWHAYILNWHVGGTGYSPEESMQDLHRAFTEAKMELAKQGKRTPRPGVMPPIEFASMEHITKYCDIGDDFVTRVLGLEWALLTDESSLRDFHSEDNNDALVAKIKEVYGVDVSDLKDVELYKILDRIEQSRKGVI